MKKKTFLVTLLVLMIVGSMALCGCGDSDTSGDTASPDSVVSDTDDADADDMDTTDADAEDADADASQEEESDEAEPEYYFKDNVLLTDDLKIEITDVKIQYDDMWDVDVIAFWYTITNLTDEPMTISMPWMMAFTAVQDNDPDVINELEVGALPDPEFRDSQLEKIKPDGSAQMAIAYQLTDDTTPVTLIATKGMLGDELGRQEYPVAE